MKNQRWIGPVTRSPEVLGALARVYVADFFLAPNAPSGPERM